MSERHEQGARPLRAVVVAEWYPSPGDPVHGVWAHRQALATHSCGVEVRVLALRRPVPPLATLAALAARPPDPRPLVRWLGSAAATCRPFELDGLTVEPVPLLAPPRPWSYGSWGLWAATTLARALARLRARWPFDLVHAHNIVPTADAVARTACWRTGVPLVASTHGPDIITVPERSAFARRALARALARADLVLANSTWAERRCHELATAPPRTRVVHLGADVPPLAALPPKRARPTLVTVAHLQGRKRHALVLRALRLLAGRLDPDYLVIGDGEERAHLERLARDLGLAERVRFLGQLPHEAAWREAWRCHAFVMPSVEEPFGVAYTEAMAGGLPAIATRGEGGPEDIARAGGGMVLVERDDVRALAEAIVRVLSPERAELGRAARATVERHFTWQRCGRATADAYRELVAARTRRPGPRYTPRAPLERRQSNPAGSERG
ncbi:MAG: glycosyltransferase [Thermoleophilum sp.]|nr:glycosyltransferase [Thermoleophilum sp.]